ncbi:hypothetical protein CLI78_09435 [Porphyromonas gingivalis]|uniref:hypothetical protein n=1 Tax=Porphyromonas gingivalis TaxID=837 RepID=UPI000BE70FEC|nr:hypothetical protein [Porphyromonas gingivalis]PDP65522.1 hypothetical protein CLI78_09435 [Porphyromonas gingivalis]
MNTSVLPCLPLLPPSPDVSTAEPSAISPQKHLENTFENSKRPQKGSCKYNYSLKNHAPKKFSTTKTSLGRFQISIRGEEKSKAKVMGKWTFTD